MVQQPQIDDPENSAVPAPQKPPETHPADIVSTTRTIMDYACQYGVLAGSILAVAVIGGVIIRKWRRRK
jgi:hypothetical protein